MYNDRDRNHNRERPRSTSWPMKSLMEKVNQACAYIERERAGAYAARMRDKRCAAARSLTRRGKMSQRMRSMRSTLLNDTFTPCSVYVVSIEARETTTPDDVPPRVYNICAFKVIGPLFKCAINAGRAR